MRPCIHWPIHGFTALLLAGCAAAPVDTSRVQVLADQVVQELVASSGFSGAVVLMRDGNVIYERAEGLAQRSPDRKFSVDTPADGGSLAKTLTAAIVWELAAEGSLSLDDPAVRLVPEYPYANHTLRQLVTHRNGLPDYDAFEADFAPGQVRDTADLLRATARRRPEPVFAPGVAVEYSNLGFDAAALAVERLAGKPVMAVWRERYLARLGLAGMFARPARFADWPVPRTPGYRRAGDAWVLADAYDGEAHIGASNVHAGVREWARWGDAFARAEVMLPARLEAGLRQPMLDSGFGTVLNVLSWYCNATRSRCHYTGAYNGFFAQVLWDRDTREVVAWVSNSAPPAWRCARFTRDLVAALGGRAATPEAVPSPVRITRADRARYAGLYRAPGLGELRLDAAGDRLFLRINRGERVSVFNLPGGVFYAPMVELWFGFSGTPEAPTLHVRSIFEVADAVREAAPAGVPAGPAVPR